jgi:dynein heavy chain
VYDPKLPFFSIVVPTVETVRYTTILDMLVSVGKPVFFTGSTGVGKSIIV